MQVITKIEKGRKIRIIGVVSNDDGGEILSVTIDGNPIEIRRESIAYIEPYFASGDRVEIGGKQGTVLYPHGDMVMVAYDDGKTTEAASFTKVKRI